MRFGFYPVFGSQRVDPRNGTFLSRIELADLTGYEQRGKVCGWLTSNGYRFSLAADGWPRVLRAAMEAKLMPGSGRRTIKKLEPDFSVYGTSSKAS